MDKLKNYLNNPKSIVLLGYPLNHSLSPKIHNYGFKFYGLDFVYTSMPIKPEDLSKLGKDFLKVLPIYGGNVTVPFKEIIFNYIDKFTDLASEVGAVNTFYKKDDEIWGDNTDVYGFTESLKDYHSKIKNSKVVVLGTGGSSKAVAKGLESLKAKEIIMVSRKYSMAQIFCDNYNQKYPDVNFIPNDYSYFNENSNLKNISLIINTTPLGMYDNQSAINFEIIKKIDDNTLFYDLIYNPSQTVFLENAIKANKQIKNGWQMLVFQAQKSFNIWTGLHYPIGDLF